jgi:hypothetical protein
MGRGRVNGGDEEELIRLIGFICIKEMEDWKLFNWFKWDGESGRGDTMYNVRLFRIVKTNIPVQWIYANKNEKGQQQKERWLYIWEWQYFISLLSTQLCRQSNI